ncbi:MULTISPECIES: metallophosphoesterase [unclassified Paenibacillus]|uniref:metallophosphoesterase n=1 Tax=unclassified Paenibacillus TaxID=185978 RepID=UPI001AE5346C|nr:MULTISPECIES: metallophosphoesterase [unclassified Paenibacillus]MBP1155517.1 putative phosphoesterase [Paenibacillus sp. PvP091]MBP1169097.1 putative phosphoesterase [Paenibacillus sp. PvR098]MBP2440125.1 putative phosphoesterase [Paenibacillus sp. PvP052]
MRIGVVSDTHMFGRSKSLPKALVEGLQGVDMILHAGDWIDEEVVDLFAEWAPVDGVAGNNDGLAIVRRFGRRKVLELAGYRIGLIHGDGGRSTPNTAFQAFCNVVGEGTVDVVVFGHSHTPYLERQGGMLLFNPGSPTDKRRQPRYSFGILRLGTELEAEHHYYDHK